jgi:hypothetical protein
MAALVGEDEVFSEGVVKLASNHQRADQRARERAANEADRERYRSAVDEVGRMPKQENKRLAAIESRLDALLLSADSSSPAPPATDSN